MRLLDLFCGAGGAAMGYHRAGFDDITGVDIKPMPRYPFKFIQGDALEYLAVHGAEYDVIHASPPCQAYTMAGQQWRLDGKEYPDMVAQTRELLLKIGKPYIIENVPGAPLINPVVLNGAIFKKNLRRTRRFETNFGIPFMLIPKEGPSRFRMGRKPRHNDPVVPVGHFSGVLRARRVMEIDWMTREELAQAIPPAYTEWIGKQLLEMLR